MYLCIVANGLGNLKFDIMENRSQIWAIYKLEAPKYNREKLAPFVGTIDECVAHCYKMYNKHFGVDANKHDQSEGTIFNSNSTDAIRYSSMKDSKIDLLDTVEKSNL
jgi:hypothetical protein